MTFRFAWFVLFISVCCAENDSLEGSGEGSGEDLLTPESFWQRSTIQENSDGDGNDILEFTEICTDNIFKCPKNKLVKVTNF